MSQEILNATRIQLCDSCKPPVDECRAVRAFRKINSSTASEYEKGAERMFNYDWALGKKCPFADEVKPVK